MTKRRRLLKIGAALLGAGMIAFLLVLASAFVGNPVSKHIAGEEIRGHISKNYPNLELEVGEVRYNFKFSEYYAEVSSPTSKDTHFTVFWRGSECYDDYKSAVLEGWNTCGRLADEYFAQIKPLLKTIPGILAEDGSRVDVAKEDLEEGIDIPLDTPYQKGLPLDFTLSLYAGSAAPTLDEAAGLLEKAYRILKENGHSFTAYGVFIQNPEVDEAYVMVYDVPPEMIERGDLAEYLYECEDAPGANDPGITVSPLKK